MNSFQISVIVPVYKTEPYIARCIESTLSQDFTDFELILVDDGSPDKAVRFVIPIKRKTGVLPSFIQRTAGLARPEVWECGQAVGNI